MSSTSGSPNAEIPTDNDFEGNIPCGTYKLNFGSNFLSNKNDSPYHILKFDIKPPTVKGNAYINFDSNDSMKLTIPTDEPENAAIYKGPVCSVKNGKECLLLFDGENLRIEKVSTTIIAKHIRCEKGDEDEEMKPQFIEPSAVATKTTTIPKIIPTITSTSTSATMSKQVKLFSDAEDEVSDGESSDDEEQMLLEQIANSTQPPSNPENLLSEKPQQQQSLPIYTPTNHQPSPARTNSSTTYHPSPVSTSSIIPTPPSKNSSLLEDLAMSDSSDSSESESDSDNEESRKSKPNTVTASTSKPEPMDYTMNEKRLSSIFNSFDDDKPMESTNNDIRNMITGGGFNLLSSDLQLSESSSDEDN
jgi:hypothetical protein|uniref:Transcription elongation factor Eaf N-terminal domain-containing protein n=1 Tax=Panagrolaimus sp. PS1159 TaxID=55785 RepID=A0AC35GCG7_9BILA